MSSDQMPTISMIMPLKHRFLASMKYSDSDSVAVKEVKTSIANDFKDWYPNMDHTLIQLIHVSTALDACFKSLPFLDERSTRAPSG